MEDLVGSDPDGVQVKNTWVKFIEITSLVTGGSDVFGVVMVGSGVSANGSAKFTTMTVGSFTTIPRPLDA